MVREEGCVTSPKNVCTGDLDKQLSNFAYLGQVLQLVYFFIYFEYVLPGPFPTTQVRMKSYFFSMTGQHVFQALIGLPE